MITCRGRLFRRTPNHQTNDLRSGVLRISFVFVAHEKGPLDALCLSLGDTSVLFAHSFTSALLLIMLSFRTRPMPWEREYFIIRSPGLERSFYNRSANSDCASLPPANCLMELKNRAQHPPCEDPAIYQLMQYLSMRRTTLFWPLYCRCMQ